MEKPAIYPRERVSVIIPVYKAEKFIKNNLEAIKEIIGQIFINFEIIVVIDGEDDKSREEALKVENIEVYSYKENKGFAIKYGFAQSSGELVAFVDCDLDLNPVQLKNFIPYLTSADFIVGSKRHPFSKIHYPFLRKLLSVGFLIYSFIILGVKLRDTQSGLKLVKREVLDIIMPLLQIKRFAFDLELCFLAQKHGFKTVEAPLYLTYQQFERISTTIKLKDIFSMFFEVLIIRYNYSVKRIYQRMFWEKMNWNKDIIP